MQKYFTLLFFSIFYLSAFSSIASTEKLMVSDMTANISIISSYSFTGGTTLIVSTSSTDETCTAENGTATASATGGTGTITYAWDNGDSGAAITGLSAGTYNVVATDAAGCMGSASVTVNQNVITLSVSASSTPSTGSDGTATASASGGTAAYSYNWDNGDSGITITGLASGTYEVTATDIDGCTGTAITTVAVLPVELFSFTGSYVKNMVLLNWSTASEINNEGFFIERSRTGYDWGAVAFIEGKGTTFELQNYQYTDDAFKSAQLFYRLKQVDFDGAFEYSKVITVSTEKEVGNLFLFPNPTSGDEVNLRFFAQNESELQFVLTDRLGRILRKTDYFAEKGENELKLSISSLPTGLYFMKLISDRHSVSKSFMVE